MDALNQQFPDVPCDGTTYREQEADSEEEADSRQEENEGRSWWLIAVIVFAIIAYLGLFIAAVLNSNPHRTDKNPGPPQGLPPAVSLHTQQRSRPPFEPRRRLTAATRGHRPTGRPTACQGDPCAAI
ncbi:hypothetical protein [Streptomyces sp. AS58]|uniref:hypothetical protein n=1 Tax=Streptomyces sp. AS58 TaxID=1519489 RepID=UPI0006B0587B|nr:hypothetical protein [Streptomyces sp. AS58]